MLRLIYIVFIVLTVEILSADDLKLTLDARNHWREFLGEPTNGLQSYVSVSTYGKNWYFELGFLAQTNFSGTTWLKITNTTGSKLELWRTNGIQISSTNPDVLAAMHLPEQAAVSEISNFHPRQGRVYQWWTVGRPIRAGMQYASASFDLQRAFDISLTNDMVLQVTPLIYKVETNEVKANLVEFPPIKVKLKSNGHVQQIE
jgi:hypothetical protein